MMRAAWSPVFLSEVGLTGFAVIGADMRRAISEGTMTDRDIDEFLEPTPIPEQRRITWDQAFCVAALVLIASVLIAVILCS